MTPLRPDRLAVTVDPTILGFETSEDAPPPAPGALQARAVAAVAFAADMRGDGYNVFAAGRPGTGRRTALARVFGERAAEAAAFDDWVYVHNFEDEHRPKALRLPQGAAPDLRDAMAELVEDLAAAIPAAFESDDYKARRETLEAELESEREALLSEVHDKAEAESVEILRSPVGFVFAPVRGGQVVKPEVLEKWPKEERARLDAVVAELQRELGDVLRRRVPALERETRAKIRALDRETAEATIAAAVEATARRFAGIAPIRTYLAAVTADLRENFHVFRAFGQASERMTYVAPLDEQPALRRYAVNVMDAAGGPQGADDPAPEGAPVVEETDPTHPNLLGRIEHRAVQGALQTDFTMIRPGALHRANGGFLILDAADLLTAPFAWAALKRCLTTGEIRITTPGEGLGLVTTTTLEPDPIPLRVKVALVGERRLFELLGALDPEFPQLFKVLADFDADVPRAAERIRDLARQAAAVARDARLRPFGREAIAAVLEETARLSGDAGRMTVVTEEISDLLREADHRAGAADAAAVGPAHVAEAVEARHARLRRLADLDREMMERDVVAVRTEGEAVGQINGLSVVRLSGSAFGRPSRITARTRMGAGRILDIEREAKLGGPLHSKGVMILSSLLASRYGAEGPPSLSASLVFEQSYGGVDGDSASSAELYALISSLADAPIRQDLAVTGSVDQYGRVQAIGGVNEKIEGFFDLCAARGLTGTQGVLIPRANVQHLNLRPRVVAAARAGRFSVIPVETIDEGLELLTGAAAGAPDARGRYPEGTVNGRAAATLARYGETMRRLAAEGRAAARAAAPGDADGEGEASP